MSTSIVWKYATLIAAICAAGMGVNPAAHASPRSQQTSAACTVTSGTLQWGVKESFRSYISGSIANGSWEVADGASYETPLFGWSDAAGTIDPATGAGDVTFTGSISFTGHDGILNMTMANPTVRFAADGSTLLLVDVRSNDAQGTLATDAQQAELALVEFDASQPVGTSPRIEVPQARVTLSEAGVAAFSNFYQAGDELDPIQLSVDLSCPESETTGKQTETSAAEPGDAEASVPTQTASATPAQGFPLWVQLSLAGAAVAALSVATWFIIATRKKRASLKP